MKELKIEVTLDVSKVEEGEKKATDAIKRLGDNGKKASFVFGQELPKSIDKTGLKIESIGFRTAEATDVLKQLSQSAGSVAKGVEGTTKTMPSLISSLGKLFSSGGAAGGVLKRIGGALLGATGIGRGAIVVTAIIGAFTAKIEEQNRKLEENKKKIEAYSKLYSSIIQNLSKEQVEVQKLVTAIKDENITRDQRLIAIEKLQKISPAHFKNLNSEKLTVDQLTLAYKNYSNAILRRINVGIREKELTDISQEILKLEDKSSNYATKEVVINGKLVKVKTAQVAAQGEMIKGMNDYQRAQQGVAALTQKEYDRLVELRNLRDQILNRISSAEDLNLFGDEKGVSDKAVKKIKTIQDVIAELEKQLIFLTRIELTFLDNQDVNRIGAIRGAVDELIKDFNLTKDSKLIQGYVKQIETLERKLRALPKVAGEINNDPQLVIRPQVEINLPPASEVIQKAKLIEQFAGMSEELAGIFEGMIEGVVSSVGDGLANLLTGDIKIGDFFKGIFEQIGSGMQELGKTLIKYAILVEAAKKFALSNPALAIGAGIALVALGGLLKNALSKKDAFATGVRNYGGGVALVGERGPELVSLPRGSSVTPSAQTSAALGGMQVFIPSTIIRGQDIVVSYNRANNSLGRTT